MTTDVEKSVKSTYPRAYAVKIKGVWEIYSNADDGVKGFLACGVTQAMAWKNAAYIVHEIQVAQRTKDGI